MVFKNSMFLGVYFVGFKVLYADSQIVIILIEIFIIDINIM